jgi:hypothetical protein
MKSTFKTTAIATVVALAALTGSSAFAQNAQTHLFSEADVAIRPVLSSSNVTRAQVQAEYLQARKSGALPISHESFFVAVPAEASTVTRAEVRSEAVAAAHAHLTEGSAS